MTGLRFVRVYGWVAMSGMLLWCIGGAGIYGSPLASFHGVDLLKLTIILLAGPTTAFIAALIAGLMPGVAMGCLLGGAFVAAIVLVLGYRSADNPLLLASLISGPMLWGAYCMLPSTTD